MKFAVVMLLLSTSTALACRFDTDCHLGSICLKGAGSPYGVCAGGPFPGNRYDRYPVRYLWDLNHTIGRTCRLDFTCGPRSICMKGKYLMDGVCVMKR
jgi:hypothetical protein